ncbi:alpha/beta hydrolase [Marmoricola sp. OAE513]|uniref:alpha/beta fold hydrolase n=1 Tax=Marmoricola sp. OAE513 TaxID=2817894 RepID=UPI001AE48B10
MSRLPGQIMTAPYGGGVRRLFLAFAVLALTALAGCGSDDNAGPAADAPATSAGSATPSTADSPGTAPDGDRIAIGSNEALVWGDGRYGVVLAHGRSYDAASWAAQAPAIAAQGATVIAVESIEPGAIKDAVDKLQADGISRVALVGGSAGADAILTLCAQEPDLADRLVLLSPNVVVDGLGSQPKLFVASADERNVDVARTLAADSPGDNELKILPGRSHAQAILKKDAGGPVFRLILDRLRP